MENFSLPLESSEAVRDYNVEECVFENQASETALLSSGALLGFKCKSPALTYAQLQLYIAFFDTVKGPLEAFTFTPKTDNTQYEVRFEKGSFKYTHEGGVYTAEFSLKRVF